MMIDKAAVRYAFARADCRIRRGRTTPSDRAKRGIAQPQDFARALSVARTHAQRGAASVASSLRPCPRQGDDPGRVRIIASTCPPRGIGAGGTRYAVACRRNRCKSGHDRPAGERRPVVWPVICPAGICGASRAWPAIYGAGSARDERSRRSFAPGLTTKRCRLQGVYGSDGTRTRDLRRDSSVGRWADGGERGWNPLDSYVCTERLGPLVVSAGQGFLTRDLTCPITCLRFFLGHLPRRGGDRCGSQANDKLQGRLGGRKDPR